MKNIYILLIALVLFGSCSDELDQNPISASSTATFFSTPNDFTQGVNAIYADLAGYPDRLFNLSETRSDNMYAVSDGGVRDWEGINSFWSTIANSGYMTEAWNTNFNGIMRANIAIEQLDQKGDNLIVDKVLLKRLKGESKFLRAFFYFDLVRIFGKVPVFDHPVLAEEALATPRNPVSEVYNLIIADLNFAKDNLLATNAATDLGRPTKYSAESLLALVYMTRSGPTYGIEGPGLGLNEWKQAATLLDDIVASGKYAFLADFKDIFKYSNEYNKEVIFDLNFISGQTPILGSHFPATLVPENWFTSKAFATMGGSDRPLSWNFLTKFLKTDKRRPHTIHNGGYKYSGGKVDTLSFYIKYIDSTAVPKTIALRFDWPINFIVSRYTDVLLLKAECILHDASIGTQATVDGYVNQVRTRAGLPAVTNVTLEQLMAERRLEFAAEGTRWHDLVRSGLVTTAMPAWIAKEDKQKLMKGTFQKEFIIYPIPTAEIDVKVGLYQQNAGY